MTPAASDHNRLGVQELRVAIDALEQERDAATTALTQTRELQAELLPMMWIPGKGSTLCESFFHIGEGRWGPGPQ